MNSTVSIVKCQSYDQASVAQSMKKAVELLGGITNFIKPKSKVLVKPNLLMAMPPEAGITTHPHVVRSVIKILKEIECTILVGDGPSVWGSHAQEVDKVFDITGMRNLCEEEKVALVKFDKRRWRGKFPLTTWLDTCDYWVNVPKFKTHNLTLLTGALKNLYGLVPGSFKTELHKNYFDLDEFAKIIVDIYQEARPALTIVDAVTAMEGDGPGTAGKLRQANVIVASSDGVAVDSILASLMGIKPFDVRTTKEAHDRGLGIGDSRFISIVGEKLEALKSKPFILPAASSLRNKLPRPIIDLARKLIKYYPCVEQDNCIRCATCIKACPQEAVAMKNHRIRFDYAKCISCFCCQESCPASAIKTKKSLFTKLLRL